MNLVEKLRPKRKRLVTEAEKVVAEMFASGKIVGIDGKLKLAKTQLNHLIAVCGEATCAEEIKNYIRYQAARGATGTGWSVALSNMIIGGADKALETVDDDDLLRVAAWRLYSVFLTRAYTYEAERHKPGSPAPTTTRGEEHRHEPREKGRKSR